MKRVLILTTFILSSLTIQQLHAQDFQFRLPGDQVSSFYGIELGNGLSLGYGLGYSANASAGTPVMFDIPGTTRDVSNDVVEPTPKTSQTYLTKQMQKKQQLAARIAKRRAAETQRLKAIRGNDTTIAETIKTAPMN